MMGIDRHRYQLVTHKLLYNVVAYNPLPWCYTLSFIMVLQTMLFIMLLQMSFIKVLHNVLYNGVTMYFIIVLNNVFYHGVTQFPLYRSHTISLLWCDTMSFIKVLHNVLYHCVTQCLLL